jgi:hypothetical protein
VVDALYRGYGDGAPEGQGPSQERSPGHDANSADGRVEAMTDVEIAAIDAELRGLLRGEETRAIAALVSLGQPALDRLLDVVAGRADVPSEVGQREREEALIGAVPAFAKQELGPVLKGVEARGLEGGFTIVWALGCVVDPQRTHGFPGWPPGRPRSLLADARGSVWEHVVIDGGTMARRVTRSADPRSAQPAPMRLSHASPAVSGERSSDSEITAVMQIRRKGSSLDEMSGAIEPSFVAPTPLLFSRVEPASAAQASARLTPPIAPRDFAPVLVRRPPALFAIPTPIAAFERPVLPPTASHFSDVLGFALAWIVTAGAGAVIAGHMIASSQPPLIVRVPFAAAAVVAPSAAPSCPKSWEPPLVAVTDLPVAPRAIAPHNAVIRASAALPPTAEESAASPPRSAPHTGPAPHRPRPRPSAPSAQNGEPPAPTGDAEHFDVLPTEPCAMHWSPVHEVDPAAVICTERMAFSAVMHAETSSSAPTRDEDHPDGDTGRTAANGDAAASAAMTGLLTSDDHLDGDT